MFDMKVSAVIPAHNSARTVVEALDSIVAQELPVHEIIVVDDMSTDATIEVVDRWHADHPEAPLVLVEQSENTGPAGARNAGIERSTGEWIALLDSDDAWLPEKTAVQLRAIDESPGVALICGRTVPLEEEVREKWDAGNRLGRELSLEEFVSHNPVGTSTVMVRRDLLLSLGGFDTQFCGPEDFDLWLRIVAEHRCLELDIPLTRYRSTVGSLSMDERKFLPQVLRVLAKAFGEGGALHEHQEYRRRAYAEQYSSASWMAYNRGANGMALRFLFKSWWFDIRRLHNEQGDPLLRLKLLFRYTLRRRPDVRARRSMAAAEVAS